MGIHFSLVGISYFLLLLIPNLLWLKFKPASYQIAQASEKLWLVLIERIGQLLVCVALIFHDDLDVRPTIFGIWPILISILCMALYLICWIRYFQSHHTLGDFYAPLGILPIPLATLPVLGIALLALYETNAFLGWATLVFAVGHIGVHGLHLKNLCKINEQAMNQPVLENVHAKRFVRNWKTLLESPEQQKWEIDAQKKAAAQEDEEVLMVPHKDEPQQAAPSEAAQAEPKAADSAPEKTPEKQTYKKPQEPTGKNKKQKKKGKQNKQKNASQNAAGPAFAYTPKKEEAAAQPEKPLAAAPEIDKERLEVEKVLQLADSVLAKNAEKNKKDTQPKAAKSNRSK